MSPGEEQKEAATQPAEVAERPSILDAAITATRQTEPDRAQVGS